MTDFHMGRYVLLAACLGAPLPAFACEPDQPELQQPRSEAPPAQGQAQGQPPAAGPQAGAADTPVPGLGAAAPAGQLAQARGGDLAMAGTATLGGVVSGNSATNVVTGANAITAGSFAGAAGIPIVIQNTGANVLIQNATIINLQLK